MVQTDANRGGLPKSVFDDLQAQLAANRSEFYRALPSGPFYGFNRPGAKSSEAIIENWWRQGMMGGAKAHYDGIVAFSQTDFTEDLKGTREVGDIRIAIQAYLFRTPSDIERLNQLGIRVRLCKGAYNEPPDVAFPNKADVDRSYVQLMHRLFDQGTDPAIAGHDPHMIEEAMRYSRERGIAADRFEFQMLYGIRRDLQRQVVDQGFRLRVYVPYGTAWYPYFMRRLSERPANVLFVARSLFR